MSTNAVNDSSQRIVQSEVVFQRSSKSVNENQQFASCELTKCFFQYPLRLMLPRHASLSTCRWVYPLNYGGGLVGGDNISIKVTVCQKCCVLWTSQSFQKVYVCDNRKLCSQSYNYIVEPESLLAILPDPVMCYKGSIFAQLQKLYLQRGSSAVILDWFTSGRTARGERWEFIRLQSKLSVYLEENLILQENLDLSDSPFLTMKEAMGKMNVFGVCVLIGPFLHQLAERIISQLGKRDEIDQRPRNDVIFAVSPIPKPVTESTEIPGCIVRFTAETTSQAYEKLVEILEPLFRTLGGNPFETKY